LSRKYLQKTGVEETVKYKSCHIDNRGTAFMDGGVPSIDGATAIKLFAETEAM